MDDLLIRLKTKIQSLEKSTEEVNEIFTDILDRIEKVEFHITNGTSIKQMILNVGIRLGAIESDIKEIKISVEQNNKRMDGMDEKASGG